MASWTWELGLGVKIKPSGLGFSWAKKGKDEAHQLASKSISTWKVKHRFAHFETRSSCGISEHSSVLMTLKEGNCTKTIAGARWSSGWHPDGGYDSKKAKDLRYGRKTSLQCRKRHLGSRKDNKTKFKTPLAASKHIGGLSLNMARVEEGHCKMLVVGAELLPEM